MELLTTVVYQTVTNRGRVWSSSSSSSLPHTAHHLPHRKDAETFAASMSSVEHFLPRYTFTTAATTYDFPEHAAPSAKKERKWSIGNLFRRSKKKDEEEGGNNSSSDDAMRKKGHSKKKDKRKKQRGGRKSSTIIAGGVFDHIVTAPGRLHRNASFDDAAILSDPVPCSRTLRPPPPPPPSNDNVPKKQRKEWTKARAVARRDSINQASSSEEGEDYDSQRSSSSVRLRSDDSLSKLHRDSRRSRTARTERYIRRLSKDDESILNREAMQRQARENWQMKMPPFAMHHPVNLSREDVDFGSRLSMHPASEVLLPTAPRPATRTSSHSSCFNLRTFSCDSDIQQSPSPEEIRTNAIREQRYRNRYPPPPPPPPRDPRRLNQCNGNWLPPPNHTPRRISQFSACRTASEDVIPTFREVSLTDVRPASVSQVSNEQFKYLTEKRARSRKPIVIQSTTRNQRTTPQIFTAQTHVQSKIFLPTTLPSTNPVDVTDGATSPFKPISSPVVCEEQGEEMKRKSANLEEALDELEAIYKSLHLGDEDLLERAEQRELSIAAQNMLDAHNETYPMSDSSFSYEPFDARKKVLKKAHTLDGRQTDDMAYRKMMQSRRTTRSNTLTSSASYLLASPVHFDATSPTPTTEPDITLDDVVYRIVKHANNSLKVIDPQPPFGIPLGPVSPAANSDYLHAVPHAHHEEQATPDVVKDDLAYRSLRKDANKEPALKPERKKRAVRSHSANIATLVQPQDNLTDIADAMEIARRILKEKDQRIQATKRAFLSDSETKYGTQTISESRLNFLNEMRCGESEKPDSLNASFEELLTALAKEARETSERITNDLHALDDTLKRNDLQRKLIRDIDDVSAQAQQLANVAITRVEQNGGEPRLEPDNPFEANLALVTEVNLSERLREQEEKSYTTNCDIFVEDYSLEHELHDDNDSQPSSGFHSNLSDGGQIIPSAFESLESPRLVTHAMRTAFCERDEDDARGPGNPVVSRSATKTRTWYGDPIVLAFACSYGIACSVQIATLDVVTILGIIFVIISIAAALLLE